MADRISDLLKRALNGEHVSVHEVGARMDDASEPDQVALHQLMHWLDDEDIRRRDPAYEEIQRAELARLLANLTSSEP